MNPNTAGATDAILVDVTGKVVYSAAFSGKSEYYKLTGLGELPAGVYFLKVLEGSNEYIQKIIK